jgi:DNA-binding transcriptional ArsR family regulator
MDVAFCYMIEFVMSEADLVGVRFAISPLNELTLSLRVLRDPGRYPLHLPWSRRLVELRPELDVDLLGALINERGWTPDFLSPRPESPFTRIDDEVDRVAATPPRIVRHDLMAIHGGLPPMTDGRRGVGRIITALRRYWELAFAPSWERMRAVLETDIAHRGRVMAQAGLGAMLAGLSDRVSFDRPVLGVRIHGAPPHRVDVAGTGVTLLPSLFALHTAVPVNPAGPPLLIYAARGTGTLWETRHPGSSTALVTVLGQVRANLLTGLGEPTSSTELAHRASVTTSAVNQHLRALRDAGLLVAHRCGRHVLYGRSELGEALVDASGGEANPRLGVLPTTPLPQALSRLAKTGSRGSGA